MDTKLITPLRPEIRPRSTALRPQRLTPGRVGVGFAQGFYLGRPKRVSPPSISGSPGRATLPQLADVTAGVARLMVALLGTRSRPSRRCFCRALAAMACVFGGVGLI